MNVPQCVLDRLACNAPLDLTMGTWTIRVHLNEFAKGSITLHRYGELGVRLQVVGHVLDVAPDGTHFTMRLYPNTFGFVPPLVCEDNLASVRASFYDRYRGPR